MMVFPSRPAEALMLSVLVLSLYLVRASAEANRRSEGRKESEKRGKYLSAFQIIHFPNDSCQGGSKNGTCYTEAECSAKGGTEDGTCAEGFGVCCIQTLNCGESTSENCTYFESSSSSTPGGCSATVCPTNDNICQLRLDFSQFQITGPVTVSSVVGAILNGVINPAATIDTGNLGDLSGPSFSVTNMGQCLTDSFAVTNPGGITPPVICGTNTGEHMYVDSSPSCNTLSFQLGSSSTGASITSRQWSIKITQYSCDYSNLAPQGCTQYFFGPNQQSGTFQTFNYQNGNNGAQLANQDQTFCIRRESQYCRICYYAADPTDFAISGPDGMLSGYNMEPFCCGYSTASAAKGFDCVVIPGAVLESSPSNTMANTRYCGRSAGLVKSTGKSSPTLPAAEMVAATVCTTQTPFIIHFRSDAYEYFLESTAPDGGFMLTYTMDSSCNLPENQGRK